MIAKLITGNGFGGAVKYSTKYGMDPDGSLHKLLAVSGVTFDYDDKGNLTINPSKVGWDFRQQTLGYIPDTKNYRPITKPVYHWILSWKEGERKIPQKEMLEVAKEFMRRVGFANTQYVISAHYDQDNQHLHIVANIVNNEGKRIVTQGLIDKAHEVAAAITKERGYAWGGPARKETIESAHKPHEKVRYIIEPIIKQALQESITEDELIAKLKEKKIETRIQHAKDGKRGRISFGYIYEGVEHSFSGGSVDRKLSYHYITNQLENNRAKAELSVLPKEKIQELYSPVMEVGEYVMDRYSEYRGIVNRDIASWYRSLGNYYDRIHALNAEDKTIKEDMRDTRELALIVMCTYPVLGFCLILLSWIMEWHDYERSLDEKRELVAKINLAKKAIETFKEIRAELDQEAKRILENNSVDFDEIDRFEPSQRIIQRIDEQMRPYCEEIEREDRKAELAKTQPASLIHVTRENYNAIRLPDGYSVYVMNNLLILSMPSHDQEIPESGLYLYRKKNGEYDWRTAENQKRVEKSARLYKKWTNPTKAVSPNHTKLKR